jgi:anhydro-N-acetylmuramic acid kinase
MNDYRIIGLMSGTSLDGLDIAYVHFTQVSDGTWKYRILYSSTVSYPQQLQTALKNALSLSVLEHELLSIAFAKFSGASLNDFIMRHSIDRSEIQCVASHGHTTHHRPELGFTLQIGCGQTIATSCNLPVINDFRTKDVVYGGQGAPLVPIGDELLFESTIDGFLNIGGISNISFKKDNSRYAFDVCPGNLPLNFLALRFGKEFDDNGNYARKGVVLPELLDELNRLEFYKEQGKNSLGLEWILATIYPLIEKNNATENLLATLVEHIAEKIGEVCTTNNILKLMITGGGALNGYLIERISVHCSTEIIIPTKETILFKEALIFAFLGCLHEENIPNCLPTATGASKAVVGGVKYLP